MSSLRGLQLLVLFGACSSTSVGNPPRNSVEIQLTAFEQAPAKPVRAAAGLTVSRALMVVERVRLRTCAGKEVQYAGPYVADLLGTGVVGMAPRLEVADRTFCSVQLKFSKLERDKVPAGAPADLVERSIVLEGATAAGRRFRVEADFDDEFELRTGGAAGLTVAAGDARIFIAFASNTWLDAAALDAIPGSGDILISKDQNQATYEAFRNAVKRSAHLFDDDDHDGRLGDAEEHDDDGGEGAEHEGAAGSAGERGEGGGEAGSSG